MFLEHYGFREQPFGVTPDPRFLYFGESHREVWASLNYGIRTGRGFMALIASPGMGKTTLLNKLMEEYRSSARLAFLFQQLSNSRDFMRSLLKDLGVEAVNADVGELTAQLNDLLLSEYRQGRYFLLILDEAQNLNDEVLETVRTLSNFETTNTKLMQIILAGQPQLADKLGRWELLQLRQRISILARLDPFGVREVNNYISHRLETAGYQGNALFTAAAISRIGELSSGIPRNINDLCFHSLSIGFAQNSREIDESIIDEAAVDLNLSQLVSGAGAAPRQPSRPSVRSFASSRQPRKVERLPMDIGSVPIYQGRGVGARHPGSRGTIRMPQWVIGAIVLVLTVLAADKLLTRQIETDSAEAVLGSLGREVDAVLGKADDSKPLPVATSGGSQSHLPTSPPMAAGHALGLEPDETAPWPDSNGAGPTGTPLKSDEILTEVTSSPGKPDQSGDSRSLERTHQPLENDSAVSEPRLAMGTKKTIGDVRPQGQMATLQVSSDIYGAKIYLNGATDPAWQTPYKFSLRPGNYRVSLVKAGYEPTNDWVQIRPSENRSLMVQCGSDRTLGGLTVRTDPPGLHVFIDGRAYGAAEVFAKLAPGTHILKVVPPLGQEPYSGVFQMRPGGLLKKTIRWPGPSTPGTNSERDRPS